MYTQAQTGWTAPPGLTFDQVVAEIIKHREANPRFGLPVDRAMVEAELDLYTCFRIKFDESYCDGGLNALKSIGILGKSGGSLEPGNPASQSSSLPRPERSGAAATKVRKLSAGVWLLLDWLGEGGVTVVGAVAESRARVCMDCPHNGKGGIEAYFTEPISNKIRRQLELKNDMELATPSDEKLGICDLCDCPLKLKVWTPMPYIRNHMPQSVKDALPDFCWIRKEL